MRKQILSKTCRDKWGKDKMKKQKSAPISFMKFIQTPFIRNHLRKCISAELLQFVAASQSITNFRRAGFAERVDSMIKKMDASEMESDGKSVVTMRSLSELGVEEMVEDEKSCESSGSGSTLSDDNNAEKEDYDEEEDDKGSDDEEEDDKGSDDEEDDDKGSDDEEDNDKESDDEKDEENEEEDLQVLDRSDLSSRLIGVTIENSEHILYENPYFNKTSPLSDSCSFDENKTWITEAHEPTPASSPSGYKAESRKNSNIDISSKTFSRSPNTTVFYSSSVPSLELHSGMENSKESSVTLEDGSEINTLESSINFPVDSEYTKSPFETDNESCKNGLKDIEVGHESESKVLNRLSRLSNSSLSSNARSKVSAEQNNSESFRKKMEKEEKEYLMFVETNFKPLSSEKNVQMWLKSEKERFEKNRSVQSILSPLGPNQKVDKYNMRSKMALNDNKGVTNKLDKKKIIIDSFKEQKLKSILKQLSVASLTRSSQLDSVLPLDERQSNYLKNKLSESPERNKKTKAIKRKLSSNSRKEVYSVPKKKCSFSLVCETECMPVHKKTSKSNLCVHTDNAYCTTDSANLGTLSTKQKPGSFSGINKKEANNKTAMETKEIKDEITKKLIIYNKEIFKKSAKEVNGDYEDILQRIIDGGNMNDDVKSSTSDQNLQTEFIMFKPEELEKKQNTLKSTSYESIDCNIDQIEVQMGNMDGSKNKNKPFFQNKKGYGDGIPIDSSKLKFNTSIKSSTKEKNTFIDSDNEDYKTVHNYNAACGLSTTSSVASIDLRYISEDVKDVNGLENYINPVQEERLKLRDQLEGIRAKNLQKIQDQRFNKDINQMDSIKSCSLKSNDFERLACGNKPIDFEKEKLKNIAMVEKQDLNFLFNGKSLEKNKLNKNYNFHPFQIINNLSSDGLRPNLSTPFKSNSLKKSTLTNHEYSMAIQQNDAENGNFLDRKHFEMLNKWNDKIGLDELKLGKLKSGKETKIRVLGMVGREHVEVRDPYYDTDSDSVSFCSSTKYDREKVVNKKRRILRYSKNDGIELINSTRSSSSNKNLDATAKTMPFQRTLEDEKIVDDDSNQCRSEEENIMIDMNERNLQKFLKRNKKKLVNKKVNTDAKESKLDLTKKIYSGSNENKMFLKKLREIGVESINTDTMSDSWKSISKALKLKNEMSAFTGDRINLSCKPQLKNLDDSETNTKKNTPEMSSLKSKNNKVVVQERERECLKEWAKEIVDFFPTKLTEVSNCIKLCQENREKKLMDKVENKASKSFESKKKEIMGNSIQNIDTKYKRTNISGEKGYKSNNKINLLDKFVSNADKKSYFSTFSSFQKNSFNLQAHSFENKIPSGPLDCSSKYPNVVSNREAPMSNIVSYDPVNLKKNCDSLKKEPLPIDLSTSRLHRRNSPSFVRCFNDGSSDSVFRLDSSDSPNYSEPLNLSTDAEEKFRNLDKKNTCNQLEALNFSMKPTELSCMTLQHPLEKKIDNHLLKLHPISSSPLNMTNSEFTLKDGLKIGITVKTPSNSDVSTQQTENVSILNDLSTSLSEETIRTLNDDEVEILSSGFSFTEAKTPPALKKLEGNQNNLAFNRENSFISTKRLEDILISARKCISIRKDKKKKPLKVVDCSNLIREAPKNKNVSSTIANTPPAVYESDQESSFASKATDEIIGSMSKCDMENLSRKYDVHDPDPRDSSENHHAPKKLKNNIHENLNSKINALESGSNVKESAVNIRDTIGNILFRRKSKTKKFNEKDKQSCKTQQPLKPTKATVDAIAPTEKSLDMYYKVLTEVSNKFITIENNVDKIKSDITKNKVYGYSEEFSGFNIVKYMDKLRSESPNRKKMDGAIEDHDWVKNLKRNDSVLAEISLEQDRSYRNISPLFEKIFKNKNSDNSNSIYNEKETYKENFGERAFGSFEKLAYTYKAPLEYASSFSIESPLEVSAKGENEINKNKINTELINNNSNLVGLLKSVSFDKTETSSCTTSMAVSTEVELSTCMSQSLTESDSSHTLSDVSKMDLETQTSCNLMDVYIEEMKNKLIRESIQDEMAEKDILKVDEITEDITDEISREKEKIVSIEEEKKVSREKEETVSREKELTVSKEKLLTVSNDKLFKISKIESLQNLKEISSEMTRVLKSASLSREQQVLFDPLGNNPIIPIPKFGIGNVEDSSQNNSFFRDESVKEFITSCSHNKTYRKVVENHTNEKPLEKIESLFNVRVTPYPDTCAPNVYSSPSTRKTDRYGARLCPKYPAKYNKTSNTNSSNNCSSQDEDESPFSYDKNEIFERYIGKENILEYLKKQLPLPYYNHTKSHSDCLENKLESYSNLEDPWDGERILTKAVREQDHQVMSKLMEMGAVLDAEDVKGRSAFTMATSLNDPESIGTLIRNGVLLDDIRFLRVAKLYIRNKNDFIKYLISLFERGWQVPEKQNKEVVAILKVLQTDLEDRENISKLISNCTHPHFLTSLCRWEIRKLLYKASHRTSIIPHINSLPLPKLIKCYLVSSQWGSTDIGSTVCSMEV